VSGRRLARVAGGTTIGTYLVLAPLSCPTSGYCKGLLAFEYFDGRNLLAPQAGMAALITGGLAAAISWLVAARPRASPGLRLALAFFLPAVTLVAAGSLGGGMMYAAPVLIPLFWWMAYQSGWPGRIAWSLLAAGVAGEAISLLAYSLVESVLPVALIVGGGIAAGAIVLLAPEGKDPDLWARP
jgi:hypothetical protein